MGIPGAPLSNGRFLSSCSSTSAGSSCTGTCNTGYAGNPSVACLPDAKSPSGAPWSFTASGACTQGGESLSNHQSTIVTVNAEDTSCVACVGGFPKSESVLSPWSPRSRNCTCCTGQRPSQSDSDHILWSLKKKVAVATCVCLTGSAACSGIPTASLPNGAFTSSCASTAVGGSCAGICSPGYSGAPVVTCLADASSPSGASWSTIVTGTCTMGEQHHSLRLPV